MANTFDYPDWLGDENRDWLVRPLTAFSEENSMVQYTGTVRVVPPRRYAIEQDAMKSKSKGKGGRKGY